MLFVSLITVSFLILVATFFAWRETSSRAAAINGVFASLTLMVSARVMIGGLQPEMAVGLPLLAGMLLLGRGLGTWWLSRKSSVLRMPATLWLLCAVATLACTVAVYCNVMA